MAKVQLIDATQWSKPLRKNLGNKNCELSDDDVTRDLRYLSRLRGERAVGRIFPNEAFGYWKVTVDRPLRLSVDLSPDPRERFRDACRDAREEPPACRVHRSRGGGTGRWASPRFQPVPGRRCKVRPECGVKLTAGRKKLLQSAPGIPRNAAEPVIKKIHPSGNVEPDSELRDTEQVPLLEEGGIESFLCRRGVALRIGCLVRAEQCQGRLRNQLHALLLQTGNRCRHIGRNTGRHSGAGSGNRGIIGRNSRRVNPIGATGERNPLHERDFFPN